MNITITNATAFPTGHCAPTRAQVFLARKLESLARGEQPPLAIPSAIFMAQAYSLLFDRSLHCDFINELYRAMQAQELNPTEVIHD